MAVRRQGLCGQSCAFSSRSCPNHPRQEWTILSLADDIGRADDIYSIQSLPHNTVHTSTAHVRGALICARNYASFGFFTGRHSFSFSFCSIICHGTSVELIRPQMCPRTDWHARLPAPAQTQLGPLRAPLPETCLCRHWRLRPSCSRAARRKLLGPMS